MSTQAKSAATSAIKNGSATTSRRAAEAAHAVIEDTANKAEVVETQLRERAAKAGEKVEASQEAAAEQFKRTVSKAESFAKERPVAAAGIAFAAGVLASALLRR